MVFGERLRELRTAAGMSQQKIAQESGLSLRTIQNYESGARPPKNVDIVTRIALSVNASVKDLLDEKDFITLDAYEKGGASAARDMKVLVQRVTGMFAGGELGDDDRDAAMRAITEAYWKAKDINKKYTPRKYRKGGEGKQGEE